MTTNQSSSHLATVLEAALGVSEASVAIADVVIYTIIHHLPATDETTERLKQFTRNTLAITQSPAHTMLSCLTYIDRYFEAKNRFNEVDPNIHQRLLLATLITGHKYMSDVTILNSAWLEVCSDVFTKDDINDMERDFLTIIGFNVKVEDRETQDKWLETIQELTENADAFLMFVPLLVHDIEASTNLQGQNLLGRCIFVESRIFNRISEQAVFTSLRLSRSRTFQICALSCRFT
ncbi:hypothetical protein BC830DRAFT_1132626 [Chytriomyces sp. MP71]|nr:hypothetical protein BC830DRAFT_1132626 [Chytriomyces sp. MP71]